MLWNALLLGFFWNSLFNYPKLIFEQIDFGKQIKISSIVSRIEKAWWLIVTSNSQNSIFFQKDEPVIKKVILGMIFLWTSLSWSFGFSRLRNFNKNEIACWNLYRNLGASVFDFLLNLSSSFSFSFLACFLIGNYYLYFFLSHLLSHTFCLPWWRLL